MRLLIAALMVLLAGCHAHTARRRVDGAIVRHVDFEGNPALVNAWLRGQTDYTLRHAITTRRSPFGTFLWPLSLGAQPSVMHVPDLQADGYRLEVWYAHRGYFDARVDGWEIREVRPRTANKAQVVDIVGYVHSDEPSLVRKVDINGLDKASAGIGRNVQRTGAVQPDDVFRLDNLEYARQDLATQLQNQSRAYAGYRDPETGVDAVQAFVEAYPEEHRVDVHLEAVPGVAARVGEIRVTGNEAIKTNVILDELRLEPGKAYKLKDLSDAQRRLVDLGTFSVVSVKPDLTDRNNRKVPIDVKVTEAKFQTVRLGGGIEYDGLNVSPKLSAGYRHTNLFHNLYRLDLTGTFGLKNHIGIGTGPVIDPVAKLALSLSQPRLFGDRRLGGQLEASITRDLLYGNFPYVKPQADARLSWRATEHVVFEAGPHIERNFFPHMSEGSAALAATVAFGENFKNPYLLTTIDGNITFDYRDDPLFPHRGGYSNFGFREAVPLGPDGYEYGQVTADMRVYMPVRLSEKKDKGVVLAGRLSAEAMHPWKTDGEIPFPERRFLGGATNLRGFWDDQVGPYQCVCLALPAAGGDEFSHFPGKGTEITPFFVPQGGTMSVLASGELRFDLPADLTGVVFTDVGALGSSLKDFNIFDRANPSHFRAGYGLGFRYKSPVGMLRLDFAGRKLYPEDWGPSQFVACPNSQTGRSFDLWSLPKGSRDLSERWLPFAIAVYFGIGEAI